MKSTTVIHPQFHERLIFSTICLHRAKFGHITTSPLAKTSWQPVASNITIGQGGLSPFAQVLCFPYPPKKLLLTELCRMMVHGHLGFNKNHRNHRNSHTPSHLKIPSLSFSSSSPSFSLRWFLYFFVLWKFFSDLPAFQRKLGGG